MLHIARPCFTRPVYAPTRIPSLYHTRFQSSVYPNTATKVDAQTATMASANTGTVSEAIKHDHAELKEYYINILSAKDDDSKIRWQNQFTWELARHSIGEELVVYPAMEKYMGEEGKHLAQKDRDEHNKVCMQITSQWQIIMDRWALAKKWGRSKNSCTSSKAYLHLT